MTESGCAPRLLATDLDGTLVGHREALSKLKTVLAKRRGEWRLAYVTGRSLASAQRLADAEGLPHPDVWVTEVGAVISSSDGQPDETWRRKMSERWNRKRVDRAAARMEVLRPQPAEAQGPFKVSYYLDPTDAPLVLPVLDAALKREGTPGKLVYSSGRDLDIVPASAGKGEAVRYLLEWFSIPLAQVLTCGDSGNDHEMLCLGNPAVMVGNAQPELRELPLPPSVLEARGACSEGILEALVHFRWIHPAEMGSGR